MSKSLVVLDERVPTRDGTLLATDVCALDDGETRPALLIRTPYSREAARDAYDLVGLARDGWSVVVQDVRGRNDSEGMFDPFTQEPDDGVDVIEWCAKQPWCDGRVVMTGVSYLGGAQWAAATRKPAELVALNPLLAPSEPPAHALWQGGAFQYGLAQSWMLGMLATVPGNTPERRLAQDLSRDWQRTMRTAAADDPVAALSPAYKRWRTNVAIESNDEWLPVTQPTFQVVGWYDVFCESGIAAHRRQAEAGHPIVSVIGPWTHNERLTNLSPEWDFGPLGSGELADLRGEGWTWLRRRLDATDAADAANATDVVSHVRYFVMGLDTWRTASSWPPPNAQTQQLFVSSGERGAATLDGDGRLTSTAPLASGTETWRHDPDDPVPSWGGRVLGPMLPLPGPTDQRKVENRKDVLTFTSAVLAHAVDVAGEVRAQLRVSSSAPSMDVAVKLCDVQPDGRVFNVVDGIARVACISKKAQLVEVSVGNTAHVFLPGHRIRIEVAGSNFPRFDLNPCTGEASGDTSMYAVAEHCLHWGGRSGSALSLPIVGGDLPL